MWQDYATAYLDYQRAESRLRRLADQREELEVSLGPSAIRYDRDVVQTTPEDHVTEILAKLADLDTTIAQAVETVRIREDILRRQRKILEDSAEIHDRIYVLHFIKHYGVRRIGRIVGYSRSQTYEILRQMKRNIGQNRTLEGIK